MAEVAELTDEQVDMQNALKQEGAELLEDGKLEDGLAKLTEAIAIGSASALLLCRRAAVLLQLGRAQGVMDDCTAALAVNPDSGKAFKLRARAYVKLEQWEKAHVDFQTGLKIDFDDQTEEESKVAEGKAKEIRESVVRERVQKEQDEYETKLAADKAAYTAAMKAREEIWTDAKEAKYQETCRKAQEEKKRKEAKEAASKETEETRAAAKEAEEKKEAADKAAAEKRIRGAAGDSSSAGYSNESPPTVTETPGPAASGYGTAPDATLPNAPTSEGTKAAEDAD